MSSGSQKKPAETEQHAYRGDHSGNQGQVDTRGSNQIRFIEHGVIRPDELFSLAAFKHRLGLSDS